MKAHFKLLFSGKYRKRTSVLIGLALIAVSLSLILGIEDNPAGITIIYWGHVADFINDLYMELKKGILNICYWISVFYCFT